MEISERLRNARQTIETQAGQILELEREVAKLEEQAARPVLPFNGMPQGEQALREELARTRAQLEEQMQIHREELLQNSRQYIDRYFQQEQHAGVNALTAFEQQCLNRLQELRKTLSANRIPADPELQKQLAKTEQMARELIERHSAIAQMQVAGEQEAVKQGYQALHTQPLPQRQPDKGAGRPEKESPAPAGEPLQPPFGPQIPRRQKETHKTPVPQYQQAEAIPRAEKTIAPAPLPPVRKKKQGNSLELNVGGRITNIIGLVLVLLAVVLGLTYSFQVIQSDEIKGAIAYLIGIVFLAGGEWMNYKQGKSPFSIGLCAGGISILFASTAVGYFQLGIFPMLAAVGICILVTAAALLLALRYDSQFIGIFALLGGYLPMTAVENSPVMILSAMAYFLLLNLFVLLLAANKKWQPIKFFSLCCSGIGMTYLLNLQHYRGAGPNTLYILSFFLLYVAVVLVYPITRGEEMRTSDTALLGINAFFCCGNVYLLLNVGTYGYLNGLMALVYCVAFFVLAKVISRYLVEDAGSKAMFYTVSAAFLVIGIPLQFEPELITLGWVAEGVALYAYGVVKDRKWYVRLGSIIYTLCLACFLLYDIPSSLWDYYSALFIWKFSAVVVGAVVMLIVVYERRRDDSDFWASKECYPTLGLKYGTMVGAWLYVQYLCRFLLGEVLFLLSYQFWILLVSCLMTLAVAWSIKKIRPLYDKAVEGISLGLYIIGLLQLLYFNGMGYLHDQKVIMQVGPTKALAWGALVLINLLAVAALFDCMKAARESGSQWAPVAMSCFSLVLTVQILLTQVEMGVENMFISFVLMAWAVVMILYGFARRTANMRRFGLAISMLSIAKLVLVDLSFLSTGNRILSFFLSGIILIGISYIYQRFSQRLLVQEGGGEESADAALDSTGSDVTEDTTPGEFLDLEAPEEPENLDS